jgi:membrane-associated phospholipid phosphatase
VVAADRRLLLHEVVFGLFMLSMAVRLLLAQGIHDPSLHLYAVLLVVNASLIGFSRVRPDSVPRWRARLIFYPIAMNVLFQDMRSAIPAFHPDRMDALLLGIDRWLLPDTPAVLLQPLVQPWLTNVMAFCYFLFLPYLFVSLVTYAFAPLALAQRFHVGLFVLYGLGFIGYSLVPAAGPWSYIGQDFSAPLAGNALTTFFATVVARGSNGVDVFPSLHCAVSAYCLFFDRQWKRWRYLAYVVPCAVLWVSTIYLRYHYLVDVICGFALAILALWLARRFTPTSLQQERPS